jgi:hypothetical protein
MTMTFRVFHAKSDPDTGRIKGGFGFEAVTFPDDYTHVCDVDAPVMGAVFQLTNHIDHPWTENTEVSFPARVDRTRLRSTSVGDVIQDGNDFYAVAPSGFVKLAALDENFQSRVPVLYGAQEIQS